MQYNDQTKRDKKAINGLQNTTQNPTKTGSEVAPEG